MPREDQAPRDHDDTLSIRIAAPPHERADGAVLRTDRGGDLERWLAIEAELVSPAPSAELALGAVQTFAGRKQKATFAGRKQEAGRAHRR